MRAATESATTAPAHAASTNAPAEIAPITSGGTSYGAGFGAAVALASRPGVGCGGGSILWTDAATSAADIRSGEGLSTSTCTWDWTTHSSQAVYGGTCGVNPTIDGGDQLPMTFAACAASATCAYTGGNAPTASPTVSPTVSPTGSGCYCAACGTSYDAGYGSGVCGVASGSCSASVGGAGCYSSKPNQGCNCATNTVQ